MAEWLIEKGIGETRALEVVHGEARAALVHWPGSLTPGQVEKARLIVRSKGQRRGLARFANGEEALVDRLAPDASEGEEILFEVVRAAGLSASRKKLAWVRPSDRAPAPPPDLDAILEGQGHCTRIVRRFPDQLWEEVIGEAFECSVSFAGGELWLDATEAMVVIDVDGSLPARELALASCEPIARSVRRMGLGGAIGIDFPTLGSRADRKQVDAALSSALADWDHEATAMNGFGFVQLVSRATLPSLLHRCTHQRAAASARALLRRAEHIDQSGPILLRAHPAVIARLSEEWLDQLRQRSGRDLKIESDPSLAIETGIAQAVGQ